MWKKSESNIRPVEIDEISSGTKVFLRKNIEEKETEDGIKFIYDELEITKDDYSIFGDLIQLITTERKPSDKIGFDWIITKVGDLECKKVYVEQENPIGVADNPFEYYDGITLIDNAYYIKDGVRQVYMNGQWVEF